MFKTPDQAVRFAFKMKDKPIVRVPAPEEIDSVRETNTMRLTAYDFHAQAAMIFSMIKRLPMEQQAALYLQHGDEEERSYGAQYLADHADRLPKHVADRNILKRAFLCRTVRDCADKVGVSTYKAWKMRKDLWGLIEPHLMEAYEYIDKRMSLS